ncbi:hypothetical protein [Catenovulum agarivorans]|uniref:hypothetical protein n=1 Tax=Catenovulum agarivorans TaxID=1172192 RepID=UPI000367FEFB|nr:hypothetical protein [Catenovulum agarivorans]
MDMSKNSKIWCLLLIALAGVIGIVLISLLAIDTGYKGAALPILILSVLVYKSLDIFARMMAGSLNESRYQVG